MFSKAAEMIEKASKIGIFTHENPDGDALGSAFGLKAALLAMGKQAEVFLGGGIPKKEWSLVAGNEDSGVPADECDLKIAVDCACKSRLGGFEDKFRGSTVSLDHHIPHEDFADVDVTLDVSSAGEVVYGLLLSMRAALTRSIAHNLYLAIVSDTGRFKYGSVRPETHEIAAELIRTGIDFAGINKVLFDTMTPGDLAVQKLAFNRLKLVRGGKAAVLSLTRQDFADCGINEEDAGEIVNLGRSVEGVDVSIYIRERNDDECKVSLRSNRSVDVSKIAAFLGGGGHMFAAGATVKGSIGDVEWKVLSLI